jgi:glutathionyl-hydroquinone reductase
LQKYDYFVNLEINTRKISKKRNFSGYETLINVSIVRWNLKEAVSKFSARRTGSGYIERVCKAKQSPKLSEVYGVDRQVYRMKVVVYNRGGLTDIYGLQF